MAGSTRDGVEQSRGDGNPFPVAPFAWIALVCLELLAVIAYFTLTPATITNVRYVLYPFVWINAGLWGVWQIGPARGTPRHRGIAALVAIGYLLLLLLVTGLLGFTSGEATSGLQIRLASPGWGPIVSYLGPHIHFTLIPYRVVGYVALAYLVYTAALETVRAALSGVIGFASCISCSFSIVLALVAGLTGGSTAAISAVYGVSIDLSTLIFLVTIGLLVWIQKRERSAG